MEKELVTSDYFVKKLNLDTDNKFIKKLLKEYDSLSENSRTKKFAEFSFYALYDIMNFQYNYTI